MPDDGDIQDDGNQCTNDGCSGGNPTHDPVAQGTNCGPQQSCNAAGACVNGACVFTCAPMFFTRASTFSEVSLHAAMAS